MTSNRPIRSPDSVWAEGPWIEVNSVQAKLPIPDHLLEQSEK